MKLPSLATLAGRSPPSASRPSPMPIWNVILNLRFGFRSMTAPMWLPPSAGSPTWSRLAFSMTRASRSS